ncbi:hybrid sensor histidine kinase/response regulator [Paracidovorax wautersii]|uniref:histidine kinase n=1 Tax=Paracidovorax wautersii TaxID=1177982 RepID=A0ABU1IAC2_9BURK|nr:hybrid sensor histidine kinase/response regulator [Paracidovorax wautersii]MDR6214155.1 signal transduction histidine kinase/CheY-like chemotaxis protein [Paracidovorax wautersii]
MLNAPDSRYPDSRFAESRLPDAAPEVHSPQVLMDLSARRQLLHSFASRGGTSEIPAIVIPGVLTWLYVRTGAPAGPMLAWWGSFLVFATVLWLLQRRFHRDAALSDAAVVSRWERIFQTLAGLDGMFWALPILLTQGAPQEFRLIVYLVICAVIASGTTFLAPQPRIFVPFFLAAYGPTLAAVVWYFPERWQAMLALVALYGAVILRHAWGSRRFVVQQVERERERQQLAEGYRLAKEQAERALEDKNRFISTTSHDLRQPLHAMGLLVETAQQRNADAQLAPVLRDVQECVRSLSFMFNALLDLSRLESGSFVARREDVRVRAVFEDVATVFAPDAAMRGLRLRLFLPRHREPCVRADPALLRQMVFNLAQNALRYTRSGGVLIGVRQRQGQWRIEVWDTGAGVAQEDRHRVYAPYFRGVQAAQGAEGHGLGLAVVARSARLIGAEYGFESTSGRGSCFWLNVLAAPDAVAAAVPAAGPGTPLPPPPPPAASTRVQSLAGDCLLVEDDPQVASALAQLLQSWGLRVETAASGPEALAWLDRGFAPDAILCDQRLAAGESGFAVLQALLERCGHARGAMVSADQGRIPELQQAEEEGYLVFRKPLAPDALHAVLTRWLEAARRTSALS